MAEENKTYIPITGHEMNFRVKETIVLKWNGTDDYDPVLYSPDEEGVIRSQINSSKILAQFDPQRRVAVEQDTGEPGHYTSSLTVSEDGDEDGDGLADWNELVYSVPFEAVDDGTYE